MQQKKIPAIKRLKINKMATKKKGIKVKSLRKWIFFLFLYTFLLP